MNDQLVEANHTNELTIAGQAANQVASERTFQDYRERKAINTLRRQDADLNLFADFLKDMGIAVRPLATDPQAWQGVTWGLVEAFVRWQLHRGYSVGAVNVRLSTVKTYARLALKAGTLDATEYALIRAVSGYSHREGQRINEQRRMADLETRIGSKKGEPVSLARWQADQLKQQPDTPQGRRDRVLMCLLLDHGLRCGEVARLVVGNFNLQTGEFRFYRPKVDKSQTHQMSRDTAQAVRAYLAGEDFLEEMPLLCRSLKNGILSEGGMGERAITQRVRRLGEQVGVQGLSAHDCRHYWATQAARNGTQLDRLQQAGGWSSLAMRLRYVQDAQIANEGVRLGRE